MTTAVRQPRGPLAIALVLALAVATAGALGVARKVESFQPLGFSGHQAGPAFLVGEVSSPASGLRPGDRIVLVDGRDLPPDGAAALLRSSSSSELTVLRDGAPVAVDYRLPPLDIDLPYLLLALIGAGYLLIGFYTLLKDRRRPARLFYFWCLASGVLYLVSPVAPFDGVGRSLFLLDQAARLLLAPLTVHLFLVFPRPLRRSRLLGRVVPFLYLPAAVFAALQADLALFGGRWLAGPPSAAILRALDRLELAHLVMFALAAIALLLVRFRTTRGFEQRRQVAWITVGMAGGYLPFLALYVVPELLGLRWPEPLTALAVAPLAVVPLTFAWAILRYRLWDLEILVRDTASLTLTALMAVLGFSLANLVVDRVVPEDLTLVRNLAVFAAGLTLAGVVIPARRRISASLERLQYGSAFGKRRALVDFGRQLMQERSLDRLCGTLLGQLEAGLELEKANLYLDQRGGLAPVRPERGLPTSLPSDLFERDFWASDVVSLEGPGVAPAELGPEERIWSRGYRYAFPLTLRDKRLGIVLTGLKEGGIPLSSDDLDLVRNLLNQATLGIENAHLLDQVQQQLHEVLRLQEFSQNIIESSPAGIAVVNRDGSIVSCNLGFGAILGLERATVVGRPLADLLPAGLPSVGEGLREFRFRDAHGRERHLQGSRARLLRDGEEELEVVVVQDVSDRVEMENSLKERERLASLGMLAAGVAHEVNTPITGISSYAQMLLAETAPDDPRHELLEKVERQTFRAARIVNNLLDFARERDGELRPVGIGRVIEDSLELVRPRLEEGGIRLEWTPLEDDPPVLGNEGELHQVFTNLMLNAVDAMAEGGTLALAVETDDERVVVRVEDDGAGMEPGQVEKIFQPFYSTKLGRGGTGLGLSISYNIVGRHNGEIRVDSARGRGTLFEVDLPRHATGAAAPAEAPDDVGEGDG